MNPQYQQTIEDWLERERKGINDKLERAVMIYLIRVSLIRLLQEGDLIGACTKSEQRRRNGFFAYTKYKELIIIPKKTTEYMENLSNLNDFNNYFVPTNYPHNLMNIDRLTEYIDRVGTLVIGENIQSSDVIV